MSRADFTKDEIEAIYFLTEQLTGTTQKGTFRKSVIVSNIQNRMIETSSKSLVSYLKLALKNKSEYSHMISAMTIHTTSWFRESGHFDWLEKMIERERPTGVFRVWCSACSTGQEHYTIGLVLESIRASARFPFEYEIMGSDIDPVSVQKAQKGIYKKQTLERIPPNYQRFFQRGSGKTKDLVAISPEIRKRSKFEVINLKNASQVPGKYDVIFCRNVLIYFNQREVKKIISDFSGLLKPSGHLVLGHSEAVDAADYPEFDRATSSIYSNSLEEETTPGKPRVLVIDDSESICRVLDKMLSPKFEVKTVKNRADADAALTWKPDIVTLDLNLGDEERGEDWLAQFRVHDKKTPVVVVSGAEESEAKKVLGLLSNGAQSFFSKSHIHNSSSDLIERLEALTAKKSKRPKKKAQNLKSGPTVAPELILIGASTGGTVALQSLLRQVAPLECPIVIVQHIPASFSFALGESLERGSNMRLFSGNFPVTMMAKNTIYMSPLDEHLKVKKMKEGWKLYSEPGEKVNGHVPAIDTLFRSAANYDCKNVMGLILTGMGRDGAAGLLELKNRGAYTLAQDEASCVVFGMPKQAIDSGAAQFVGNLEELRDQILQSQSLKKAA